MSRISRRGLGRLTAGAVGAALGLAVPGPLSAMPMRGMRSFERVALVDGENRPLRAADLSAGADFIFHYPFAGTPCLLIDLGRPAEEGASLATAAGERYKSLGGVGPKGSVVAFVAICTHMMSHPTRRLSLLNYYPDKGEKGRREKTIACCAHGSVFDPLKGAKVMVGEAIQPLPSVVLEHDAATDGLFATGILGDENLFHHFFTVFNRDLRWQYGGRGAERPVQGTAVALPSAVYSQVKVSC